MPKTPETRTRVHIKLDPVLVARLDAAAKERNLNRTEAIAVAVEHWITQDPVTLTPEGARRRPPERVPAYVPPRHGYSEMSWNTRPEVRAPGGTEEEQIARRIRAQDRKAELVDYQHEQRVRRDLPRDEHGNVLSVEERLERLRST